MLAALGEALSGRGGAFVPVPDDAAQARRVLAAAQPDEPLESDCAVVLPTSGSTGEPKAVLLTAGALRASATATHDRLGGPGQWLLAMPPYLVAGLQVLTRSLVAGTSPVVAEGNFAAAVAGMTGERRYTALVPTQLKRLLDTDAVALRQFDAVLVGGAAVPPALLSAAEAAGVRVVRTYGMTETGGGCVYDGLPLDGVSVDIVDDRVVIGGPGRAATVVTASGCATAKVKVAEPGQALADDVARVEAVRSALGPGGRIRVDANGAWDVSGAVRALRELARFGLEYAEQPCATVEELALVRRRVDVPVAADESIRRASDPYRVRELDAADIAVLKVQPLGGVWACLEIAERIGLPVVVSSALETSVGMAAGVALAAALPELPYACGLATVSMFEHDVAATPLLPVDGALPVVRVDPDPDLLAAAAADEGTTAAWRARLDRVRRLG